MNKSIIKSLALGAAALLAMAPLSSCEDYLDKDPDTDVTEDQPFRNFTNAQGYVEEIYNCIPNKVQCSYSPVWNFGDDEIMNPQGNDHLIFKFDQGDFYAWQGHSHFWFGNTNNINPSSNGAFNHGLYAHGWYCISKCNKGLDVIDQYFKGTKDELNAIKGQLYFFRAWYHFEMMQWLGGIPYINQDLTKVSSLEFPRLSYQECADSVAKDFAKAAELLPLNWDEFGPGLATLGNNDLRVTKITALSYLGKNYLWAASPLMENGASLGGSKTYLYNQEYAKKAAQALGEVITMVESGATQYELATFDYENVYNHEVKKGVKTSYSELFWTQDKKGLQPGGQEAIMRGPSMGWSYTRYNHSRVFGPNPIEGQDNLIHHPTANYVEFYGMANGLPLDDPESGYDAQYPFRGRDPRFYHDIIFDGVKYILGTIPDSDVDNERYRYAALYTDGAMRNPANSSRTGYLIQKLVPHQCNKYDNADEGYIHFPHAYISYMRLADVYLMYAEAAAAAYNGPQGKDAACALTAKDAIDRLRDRVGAGHVADKYTGNAFMDEVRRERAVELSFEGFRFNDLQRWLLLTEPKYTTKYAAEFVRMESDDFFVENDPAEARVANYRLVPILTRQYQERHYWLPFYRDDTYLYEGFQQNPGW